MPDVADADEPVTLDVHLGQLPDAVHALVVTDERKAAWPSRSAGEPEAAGDNGVQAVGSDDGASSRCRCGARNANASDGRATSGASVGHV